MSKFWNLVIQNYPPRLEKFLNLVSFNVKNYQEFVIIQRCGL